MVKGFKKDGKFHPIKPYNKVRKSRATKEQGVKVERKARTVQIPSELERFDNLKMIRDVDTRRNVIHLLQELRRKFIQNDMDRGMLWSFLEDCVNGQILISLDKKPDHYVNRLSDFYIDTRVGFKGTKEVYRLIDEIRDELKKIVKYEKPKFVEGDIVKSVKDPNNAWLRDQDKSIKYKIMKMERDLDPHYVGYYMVDVTKKPFKKNWIYAGVDDLR